MRNRTLLSKRQNEAVNFHYCQLPKRVSGKGCI